MKQIILYREKEPGFEEACSYRWICDCGKKIQEGSNFCSGCGKKVVFKTFYCSECPHWKVRWRDNVPTGCEIKAKTGYCIHEKEVDNHCYCPSNSCK